eukprot:2988219-Alexandrium_andersonii.AAC.1
MAYLPSGESPLIAYSTNLPASARGGRACTGVRAAARPFNLHNGAKRISVGQRARGCLLYTSPSPRD